MIAAKIRCKLITVVAADAIWRVGNRLQRREGQCLVTLACLIADCVWDTLRMADDVALVIRYCDLLSISHWVGGRPPSSNPRGSALDSLRSTA